MKAIGPNHEMRVVERGAGSFGAGGMAVACVEPGREPYNFCYSLFAPPHSGGARTRRKDAGRSSYYRRFYMGLIGLFSTAKLALEHFARHTPAMAIMQWFHFEDRRLGSTIGWPKRLEGNRVRTESTGIARHHNSPPKDQMYFADFCASMIERYAPARPAEKAVA